MKIDLNKQYAVKGAHKVIGIFHDEKNSGSFHEYLVVWKHSLTGEVFVGRVDSNGRAFGQGQLLVEVV